MTTNTYNSESNLPFGLKQDEGHFATLLYTGSRGYSGKMARQLMKDPKIKKWIEDGQTYSKKRQTNVEQFLYNLIEVRRTQLLINDAKDFVYLTVRLAIPLRDIKTLHKYIAQYMSYTYIRDIIERLSNAGYIHYQIGHQQYVPEVGSGQVTRVGITSKFENLCDQYLDPSPPMKHGVDYYICPQTIHMKDVDGNLMKYDDNDFPVFNKMREILSDYNKRMKSRNVTLRIPLSDVCLSGSLDRFTLSHQNATGIRSSESDTKNSFYISLSSSNLSHPLHYCSNTKSKEIDAHIRDLESKATILTHIAPTEKDGCLIYKLDDYHLFTTRKFCRSSSIHGGRHYAPIQNLPSEWRKYLCIDDEPVVELDYDGLHMNMLYHAKGIEPTYDDAYQIDDFPEVPRKTLKTVTMVLINSRSSQSYYACVKSNVKRGDLDLGPYGAEDVKAITRAIRDKHDPIRDFFWSDIGIKLQYRDSKIASHIMSEMDVIHIHDGFVCRASEEERLRALMQFAYQKEMGDYEIGISREFAPLTSKVLSETSVNGPNQSPKALST